MITALLDEILIQIRLRDGREVNLQSQFCRSSHQGVLQAAKSITSRDLDQQAKGESLVDDRLSYIQHTQASCLAKSTVNSVVSPGRSRPEVNQEGFVH